MTITPTRHSEGGSRQSKPRASAESASRVVNEIGIEIKPLYTARGRGRERRLGPSPPGEPPFTRGIHPLMYRHRPWTMRQYTGFANAADTNQRFKYLIANGQTGLNVAFDLATQCGYDSDAPEAMGEVGRVGMAVDTLRDFEIAFDGIDLDAITVSLTINGAAAILIAMYLAMAEKRGYDLAQLRGTAQNDILKEFIGRGTWMFPVDPSVKLVADTIEYCAQGRAQIQPRERLRLSHPRVRCDAGRGDGLRLLDRQGLYRRGARARARHRRFCRTPLVQFQHLRQPVRAGGEVPGRTSPLGEDHPGAIRRETTRLPAGCG